MPVTQGIATTAKRKLLGLLLASPAFLTVLFFAFALLVLLQTSLFESTGSQPTMSTSALTLSNYRKLLSDPLYLDYFLVTIRVSVATVILSLLLGLPMAFWIVRTPNRTLRAVLIIAVTIPFLTSIIVRLYALTQVLANTGLINQLLRWLGVIAPDEFVPLIRNEFGVILGTTSFALPFVIFMLTGVFRRFDQTLEEAAASLGADELTAFRMITLPLLMPGIVSAALLAFVLASVAFSSPLVLGGGVVDMVANAIYSQAVLILNRSLAAALAVLALMVTLLVLYLSTRLERGHRHA
jgi:putative spermidine/putrescine transport system permease protein